MDKSNGAINEMVDVFLSAEGGKLGAQAMSQFAAKYGELGPTLSELTSEARRIASELDRLTISSKDCFNPSWRMFERTLIDTDDLKLAKFLKNLGLLVEQHLSESSARVRALASLGETFRKGFESTSFGVVTQADEAGGRIIDLLVQEFESAVVGFGRVVAGVYLGTKKEYKNFRKQYLGEAGKLDEPDDLEDDMLSQLFGGRRPPKQDRPAGPAIALVDDNVVWTQLLLDLTESVPREYERVVPILSKGKPTGNTKTVRYIDDGEIEECAKLFGEVARGKYREYAMRPDGLQREIMRLLKAYYLQYKDFADKLREAVSKLPASRHMRKDLQVPFASPFGIERQYTRINFLAIRPMAEDVAPRTRIEREFQIAREKMLAHVKETLNELNGMDPAQEATFDHAVLRIKEAVAFKQDMLEITKSEQQRALARDIRDDNEFYVGKSGQIGSFTVERENAPAVKYEDIVGASFTLAKAHIEEVVEIASHPRMMRATSPRGDVRSNILLIGPYGCGKTLVAKAACADRRIIGMSVSTSDLLTAYMHESVKNVKRMYEKAKELRKASRDTKAVGIALDEFDGFFTFGEGVHAAYDGTRMEKTLQEMMDGVLGYEGVFLVALTNEPKKIPEAIRRRFKYVDVVGELSREERVALFRKFLTRGLPLDPAISEEDYGTWADMLEHAPGDVLGKVADEVHFKYVKQLHDEKPKIMASLEQTLNRRLKSREMDEKDRTLIKSRLSNHKIVSREAVETALKDVLRQPQVVMQIDAAKKIYKQAKEILDGLSVAGDRGLGFQANVAKKSELWSR